MKYNIEGYNQQKLLDSGLDCVDAVILRWYADFQHSGNMAEIEHKGKTFYWLKYNYINDEIPIIKIKNKESLYRRMKKLVNCGIMEHYTKKSGGTFSCFRVTKKYYALMSDSKSTQKSGLIDSKVSAPIDSKVGTKDSSTKIDSSTKDKGKKKSLYVIDSPPSFKEVEAYIKEKGYKLDPKFFMDKMEAAEWADKNGKKYIKWKSVVVTYEGNNTAWNKTAEPAPRKVKRFGEASV